MLPCLDALSLTSHDASPTGVRNEATKPRRPLDMNKILKNTTEVHKRAALARGRGGGRGTPNYDEDAPPPRMSIQEGDNRCPECPSYVGEWSPPYSGVYKPLNEQMGVDPDDGGQKKCRRCGLTVAAYTNDTEPEKRNFDGVNRSHHSEVQRDEQVHLNQLSKEELELTPDDPPRALWTTNNRLQQSFVWLEKMGNNEYTYHADWWLTQAEVVRAKRLLRGVCKRWAINKDWGNARLSGSPILWSILAALQMAAERENGYAVRTKRLQQLLTIMGLHDFLGNFVGESQRTEEQLGSATIARGKYAQGAQYLDQHKYRMPDYDAIPQNTLIERIAYFNLLAKQTNMLAKWDGIDQKIRLNQEPELLAPPPAKTA